MRQRPRARAMVLAGSEDVVDEIVAVFSFFYAGKWRWPLHCVVNFGKGSWRGALGAWFVAE